MNGLAKATLVALTADAKPTEKGTPIKVQFNPTSLRLSMTNSIDSGKTRGHQAEQYLGTSSTTLSCDLVFDTADEGTTATPRNVREKTMQVARFVLPEGDQSKQAPPRVRFHWGDFIFDGVMTGLTEDIDLFSEGGVPLRAKVTISIKEQDPRYAALESGAGAAKKGNAPVPGAAAPSLPGGVGAQLGADRTGLAIGGESAAEFAARMGLDPAAWRGLAANLPNPLSLQAGAEIDFSSRLSVGAGIGLSAGIEAGLGGGLEASLGLTAGAGAGAGLSLAAARGVRAALETVQIARSETAAAKARAAFEAPPPSPAPAGALAPDARPLGERSLPRATAAALGSSADAEAPATPAPPEQPRPRLIARGLPSPAAQAAVPPAPLPPRADPRATTFGYGAPLRPRVGGAAEERTTDGWVVVRARERDPEQAPVTRDPTVAPWLQRPALAPERATVELADGACACGCGGGAR
jgi:hypothetical protein